MSDLNQARAVAGALLALLASSFTAAALISNDLYTGNAEMGAQQETGWWDADVQYGFFNGTVWIGENDNLFGIPNYTLYEIENTGKEGKLIAASVILMSCGAILALITSVLGMLISFKRVSWVLPLFTGMLSIFLVLLPMIALYNVVPVKVEDDLEALDPSISEAIPEDEMDNLEGNLSRGSSFFWGFLSVPFLTAAPILMAGIKRERAPSKAALMRNFFKEGEHEKETAHTLPDDGTVTGGNIDHPP
ncbi:MAG: hypothetical protein JW939_08980 [Candidatus Thermoplasmatota archaeon]|nr:hypothetical protein [Candidatus Thermoplasmatota archaeon]